MKNTKKSILFVLPSLVRGGMEKMQIILANKLVRNDYDVTLLLLEPVYDLKYQLDDRIRVIYKSPDQQIGRRIPYIRYKFYDDDMWESRSTPRQLYKYYIGSERYDVEVAFFRGLSTKIISGSTNSDAVHLAWVHSDSLLTTGWKRSFSDISEVFEAYSRFDKVICVSDNAKESFIAAIGDTGNLMRIYNMLPVDDILLKAEKAKPTEMPKARLKAIIVARLRDEVKGHLRLISCISRLHDKGADISLTIVGSGIDEDRIRALIEEKNASSYIILTGGHSNPYPYIKGADLLVCSSYHEGFNLSVAEALILGVPVLSTNCAGPVELLDGGKYGMLVENSEEGLYEGIKKLYDAPRLLAEYAEKGKQRRDFFDEEKVFKQITDLWGD